MYKLIRKGGIGIESEVLSRPLGKHAAKIPELLPSVGKLRQ